MTISDKAEGDHVESYAFRDYLEKGLQGKNTRDSIEYQWHKEKQAPDKHTYDPDESKIDFHGPTREEYENENSD